jgi:hypothetical protein
VKELPGDGNKVCCGRLGHLKGFVTGDSEKRNKNIAVRQFELQQVCDGMDPRHNKQALSALAASARRKDFRRKAFHKHQMFYTVNRYEKAK